MVSEDHNGLLKHMLIISVMYFEVLAKLETVAGAEFAGFELFGIKGQDRQGADNHWNQGPFGVSTEQQTVKNYYTAE